MSAQAGCLVSLAPRVLELGCGGRHRCARLPGQFREPPSFLLAHWAFSPESFLLLPETTGTFQESALRASRQCLAGGRVGVPGLALGVTDPAQCRPGPGQVGVELGDVAGDLDGGQRSLLALQAGEFVSGGGQLLSCGVDAR